MKKYYLVIFCAILLFAVGCGNKNQLKCSGSMSEGGIEMSAEVVADFDKDDKLTDATIVYDLKDKNTADQYCSFFKMMESAESGVKIDCSGSKITINGYGNLADGEESAVGKTKEEFKELLKSEGLTCK